MNVKVVVFDLDDTLYDEITFVYSGFKAVADHFAPLNAEAMLEEMIQILERDGRGGVFDSVLQKYELYSKTNVKKALSIYRAHTPNIKLNSDAKEILDYLKRKNKPLYIVTDGNKNVQANKLKALGIEEWIKKSFVTHRYAKIHAKPSAYCFIQIAKLERCNYEEILYIADNIHKDFVNIKKLGFRTIRIRQGMFANAVKPQEFHAQMEIKSLIELKKILKG